VDRSERETKPRRVRTHPPEEVGKTLLFKRNFLHLHVVCIRSLNHVIVTLEIPPLIIKYILTTSYKNVNTSHNISFISASIF